MLGSKKKLVAIVASLLSAGTVLAAQPNATRTLGCAAATVPAESSDATIASNFFFDPSMELSSVVVVLPECQLAAVVTSSSLNTS